MSIETARLAAAPEPSPLLRHLAGEAAEWVTQLWPAPHAAYFALSAARRHLIGMAAALETLQTASRVEAAIEAPLRRAMTSLLPGAPPGLGRALERMGEAGWPLDAYRRLFRLLTVPAAAKVLRHADTLDRAAVAALGEAHSVLLEAGLAGFLFDPALAAILGDAYAALVHREGAEEGAAGARRWGEAQTAKALFARVERDLLAARFPAPFPGTPNLRWLDTPALVRGAARRYRNCLADHLEYAAIGEAVFGEWLTPPGAVVRLVPDPVCGWRLADARGAANAELTPATLDSLAADLGELGVWMGVPGRDLLCAARWAGRRPSSPVLPELMGQA